VKALERRVGLQIESLHAAPTLTARVARRIADVHRRNCSWARGHPGQRDETCFKREIAPKLDAFSLKEIGEATGFSLAACSRIRAAAKVPHPRHWDRLLALVQSRELSVSAERL
jgi:hypothetical protein